MVIKKRKWKEELTPGQQLFISAGSAMIDCVENDIKQAFDEAETMEEFVEKVVDYMTQISSEALSVLPQLVKVFCSEPAEELKKELKRRNG